MASSDPYDRRSKCVDEGRDTNSWCCWRGDDGPIENDGERGGEEGKGEKTPEGEEEGSSASEGE